jgi:hypothetical protein
MIGRGVRPFKNKPVCLVYDLSDEIHNICSFNVLGGIPTESMFQWSDGEKLTSAVNRHSLTSDDIQYEYNKFNLYEKENYHTIPAMEHQKYIMDTYNLPFMDDISMSQAAYLIFKTKLMEKHGFNSRDYWKEWRENIPMCGEVERKKRNECII